MIIDNEIQLKGKSNTLFIIIQVDVHQEFPFAESVRGATMTHCLVSMATIRNRRLLTSHDAQKRLYNFICIGKICVCYGMCVCMFVYVYLCMYMCNNMYVCMNIHYLCVYYIDVCVNVFILLLYYTCIILM